MRSVSFSGSIPANLLPFTDDFSIDEPAYRRHLEWLVRNGADAITCNGHAAEVSSLTRDERKRALAIALDQVHDRVPVVAGVYADGTLEAIQLARDALALGAAGILVFPPSVFVAAGERLSVVAHEHFARIADAVDIPIIVFRYPAFTNMRYSTDVLVDLASIHNVVAVKDWSQDIVAFEEGLRALRSLRRPISILTSYSASLLSTLVLGADGILSGNGSVICDLHAALYRAVKVGDFATAMSLNERLFPLTQVFYSPPLLDQHNRMKEALVLLGRLDKAVVRPPLCPIASAERHRIKQALSTAGLLQAVREMA